MTTIAQTKTPFERFITRLVVQVKQGKTFAPEELHRLMVAFASTEGVRFTRDEVDGVLTTFSSHAGAPATVTFATATGAQSRDAQGRWSGGQERYRGKDLTPEYRQQLLASSPIGRQLLKAEAAAGAPAMASTGGTGSKAVTNDYQQQSLTYTQLWRQALKDEAATQGRR